MVTAMKIISLYILERLKVVIYRLIQKGPKMDHEIGHSNHGILVAFGIMD